MIQSEPDRKPPAASLPQNIGTSLLDFTLQTVTGGTQSLSSALAGKLGAVVVFWSGICSHCLRYDDYFNNFTALHPNIAFLAIASRQQESPEQVRGAIAERRLTFPILDDSKGQLANLWFTRQTPRAFLIGPDMKLLYRGAIDNFQFPGDEDYSAYLEPAIADMLAGRPITQAETASFGCAIQSVYYIMPKSL